LILIQDESTGFADKEKKVSERSRYSFIEHDGF
jgi:hypothetical protein